MLQILSLGRTETDEPEEPDDPAQYDFPIPEIVLRKIFSVIPVESMLKSRLVCKAWNNIILDSELLDERSCFVFDGRKEDGVDSSKCSEYMDSSENKNYLWSHLKLRRVVGRHCSWIYHRLELDPVFTSTVSTLELLNSTLNWAQILQLLMDFDNLAIFIDRQDVYCWDYMTFNSGIEEDEPVTETAAYAALRNLDKISSLIRLRTVRIHRSQLIECTTYLKLLQIQSHRLQELEINTDQNFAPQRGSLFYLHLGRLLSLCGGTLRLLKFPYKLVCPSYDFRITDEHRLFREFLNYITEAGWVGSGRIRMRALEELSIQFGIVPVEGLDFVQKLAPFIQSLPNLKKFYCGYVHFEGGMETALLDFLNLLEPKVEMQLGIFMNDALGLPNIQNVQHALRSLSIQTYRDTAKELVELLPSLGTVRFKGLHEFQYFSKNHNFRNFNFPQLIYTFPHLSHLNLVDHNARLETRHSCEALATIEDADIQLIARELSSLVSLQIIGNMTFLTDAGLTGLSVEVTKRLLKSGAWGEEPQEGLVGVPMSKLQNLKACVFRGLGIKITDVSARKGFNGMPFLTKLHLYGCHQITAEARQSLMQMYSVIRGCDLQV